MVKLWINGIQAPIIVDDEIPVHKNTKQPAFAHSNSGALWISLIEKAWAKLHGSYALTQTRLPQFVSDYTIFGGTSWKDLKQQAMKEQY